MAVWLRVRQIELRPLHNDEGVNYHFLEGIRHNGFFRYSHENYHGPSYFYLSALCTAALGQGELGLRSSAVLAGVATLLLLLALRRSEGDYFVLTAALLCALSSSMVFYSRYAIHETLFVFAGACLALGLYLWLRTEASRYLYAAGLALGVLVATKETFIITLFCIALALLAGFGPRALIHKCARGWQALLQAGLIAAVVIALLFSGGLHWSGGLREMFLAVPQWIGRNRSDVGHFKPFWYYADILLGPQLRMALAQLVHLDSSAAAKVVEGAESQLWLALAIPLTYFVSTPLECARRAWGQSNAFMRFCGVWALCAFVVYSLVSYKTPWLAISITLPVTLFLAAWIARLAQNPSVERWVGGLCVVVALALGARNVWKYNFDIPYGRGNPYSYVHTDRGLLRLVRDIEGYRELHPGAKVLVGVSGYWPLPYYLRKLSGDVGYLHTREPESQASNYQIQILDPDLAWKNPRWSGKYYRLSEVQESETYFLRQR
jgi:uncharacterized protein (TIGR03663 family)